MKQVQEYSEVEKDKLLQAYYRRSIAYYLNNRLSSSENAEGVGCMAMIWLKKLSRREAAGHKLTEKEVLIIVLYISTGGYPVVSQNRVPGSGSMLINF